MQKISMLYHPFQLKKTYEDVHEERILSSFYNCKKGSIEAAISGIINTAVLGHMNLCIDSTIMQMLALNDNLSYLFIINFEKLIYNYAICYIENKGIETIEDEIVEKIENLSKQVNMKTELEELILKLDRLCEANCNE